MITIDNEQMHVWCRGRILKNLDYVMWPYRLETQGATLEELVDNAYINILDYDKQHLDRVKLSDISQDIRNSALRHIENRLTSSQRSA